MLLIQKPLKVLSSQLSDIFQSFTQTEHPGGHHEHTFARRSVVMIHRYPSTYTIPFLLLRQNKNYRL
jgi:hypothetical protein